MVFRCSNKISCNISTPSCRYRAGRLKQSAAFRKTKRPLSDDWRHIITNLTCDIQTNNVCKGINLGPKKSCGNVSVREIFSEIIQTTSATSQERPL